MTTRWPVRPVIFEINTWAWLRDVSTLAGHPVTLGEVPAEVWDATLPAGVDAVWLMGVWERSPAGLDVARADAGLQESFHQALPDVVAEDVVGSPYCVRRYVVDALLGGPEGLAAARAALAARGLRLILDYVPNHVAPDHPWATAHPERFVRGTHAELEADPAAWLEVDGNVLARGKDPYFAPWPDVVQLDGFAPTLRAAAVETLASIGAQADGVRCDMAMLLMSDVFASTWGERVGPVPEREFWPEVIERVRDRHPGLVFIAEAYWDREWGLQQQGFDFCYDKRFYDRLVHEDAGSVRGHLQASGDYQRRLVRFIENHDEPRAAATFGPQRQRAASVCIATVPGAVLWHQGQPEGRRVRLPVFLARWPLEAVDGDSVGFHEQLLAAVAQQQVRTGTWSLLWATGWPDNDSARNLLAWAWTVATDESLPDESLSNENLSDDPAMDGVPHHVVVVNFSDRAAQGRVRLPWSALDGRTWRLTDELSGAAFDRVGEELAGPGLFVDLEPWGSHLLRVSPVT